MSENTGDQGTQGGQAGEGAQATTQTSASKPWYDGADTDTVGYIQNKKWDKESPLKVLESYRNLEKFHGVPADKLIKLPNFDDTEGWNGVWNRLGRPESPDKYGMDSIKKPEGVDLDNDMVSHFDKIFHAKGISKDQRDGILNDYIAFEAAKTAEIQKQYEAQKAEQVDALKKEWGPKYEERLELAKRAFRAFIPEGVDKDQLASTFEDALGTGIFAKMFSNLADRLAEDKFHDGDNPTTPRFGDTREQAVNRKNTLIAEIKADPQRLANFNKGVGVDYEKIQKLNSMIVE